MIRLAGSWVALGWPAGQARMPLEDLRGDRLRELDTLRDRLGIRERYGRLPKEVP